MCLFCAIVIFYLPLFHIALGDQIICKSVCKRILLIIVNRKIIQNRPFYNIRR